MSAAISSGAIAAAAPAERKLRILCMHGYLQNAEVFKNRLGSLRKALKARAEFIFVDAPHIVVSAESAEADAASGTMEAPRAWWLWEDAVEGLRPSGAQKYVGWQESNAMLAAALTENEPIDGMFGFSQGATAVALFLAGLPEGFQPPKFAIMVGGFLPKDEAEASKIAASQTALAATSSLFVFGTEDMLITPDRSQQLIDSFPQKKIQVYQHHGAHFVPTCTGEFKKCLVKFLSAF